MINLNLLIIFFIAVALSLDAFSLALSLGTMSFSKKENLLISLSVGVFHFFMPILGSLVGHRFIDFLNIDISFFSAVIFLYIALQMFKEFKSDEQEIFKMNICGLMTFALGVSLDSFGVGFTIHGDLLYLLVCALIFSVFSFVFTFIGLNLGKIINKLIGSYAILLGTIVMTVLAIVNFVNFCALD